jgi:hypothetical protein
MTLRVVFDTNVVVSALRFQAGHVARLRAHWAARIVRPLGSRATVDELAAVLAYQKFELTPADITALLGDFLPYIEVVDVPALPDAPQCRDPGDQKFVDLAIAGRAQVLVTGDKDLLALKALVPFAVESPAEYARRFVGSGEVREPRAGYAVISNFTRSLTRMLDVAHRLTP